ncbi:hypothetical protein NDU88_008638 [Pleurodeles waltl]|uniref:Uncharacterized protein n=1 Tax=Pleurodeles waltl TaxID=8319 RepID=A0AAV7QSA9_PLEWA|nr:hypothetical protein NDU88_008638 [Pleurodeles waltl]
MKTLNTCLMSYFVSWQRRCQETSKSIPLHNEGAECAFGCNFVCVKGKDMLGCLSVLMSSLVRIREPCLETRHTTGEKRLEGRRWRSYYLLFCIL